MKYRLKDEHPVAQRFSELIDKAYELNLSLGFTGGSMCQVILTDTLTGHEYKIEDTEGPYGGWCEGFDTFPMPTEYKITFEKQ